MKQDGRVIYATSQYVERVAIPYRATANDRVSVVAISAFMVIDVSDAYRCLGANMEAVTCPSNASAIRAGMVYSAQSVSFSLDSLAFFSSGE